MVPPRFESHSCKSDPIEPVRSQKLVGFLWFLFFSTILKRISKSLEYRLGNKTPFVHSLTLTMSTVFVFLQLIDLEFSFVGPVAFDIGMLIANYIFQYYHHMSIPENNDEHRKFAYLMIDMCKSTGE